MDGGRRILRRPPVGDPGDRRRDNATVAGQPAHPRAGDHALRALRSLPETLSRRWSNHGAPARRHPRPRWRFPERSEEHTSELQSLMRISYAVFCLKKKNKTKSITNK